MRRATMGTWLTAGASLALVSCADPGPVTTAHDGVWSGKPIAPADCAGSDFWGVDFVISQGKIRGTAGGSSAMTGGQYLEGTVYADGSTRMYITNGPHYTDRLRLVDIEFKGDSFTMTAGTKCSSSTVEAGTRIGPVPWWDSSPGINSF